MDLSNIDQGAKIWLVTFNPSKTDAMLFTNHLDYDYHRYYLVNIFFIHTLTHKHNGVTLQSTGKWDVHIDEMISKTMKMIGVLRKMKFVLSRRCLNTMYIYILFDHHWYRFVLYGIAVQHTMQIALKKYRLRLLELLLCFLEVSIYTICTRKSDGFPYRKDVKKIN